VAKSERAAAIAAKHSEFRIPQSAFERLGYTLIFGVRRISVFAVAHRQSERAFQARPLLRIRHGSFFFEAWSAR
jgi:hypothetical protein